MSQLTQEQEEEIVTAFNAIDLDGSGKIDTKELQALFRELGLSIPGFKIREMIDRADKQNAKGVKDSLLTLEEFKQLYLEEFTKTNVAVKFAQHLQKNDNLKTHGGTSEASTEGTTHSIKNEEEVAFTDWINRRLDGDADCKKYLKITEGELYKKCQDGVLLCKLINDAVPDTIDDRTINLDTKNVYKRSENHQLALNSARAIGCRVVNIGGDDINAGSPHLILGLMWQIIRIGLLNEINLSSNPHLHLLLEEGEDVSVLKRLSPEEILIRWVNYHLKNSESNRRIKNFSEDIKDSEVYTYLLHEISSYDKNDPEKRTSLAPLQETGNRARAESMLCEADKLNCRAFVTAKDVENGNPKLNLAFVANLFNTCPALEGDKVMEENIVEETREEKTYRNWMNSMDVKPRVNYLYGDLSDGCVFLQLFDIIKKGSVDWKKAHKVFSKIASKAFLEKLENCNYAVDLGKQFKFSLVGISGDNLRGADTSEENMESTVRFTLAILWQLMRAYTLSVLNEIKDEGQRELVDQDIVNWANEKLKEAGKSSSLTSFRDPNLADGIVVIDTIDAVSPNAVNYSLVKTGQMTDEDRFKNAKYAISLARKIGARVYALPEDITEVKSKMIMTIFACLNYRDKCKKASSN